MPPKVKKIDIPVTKSKVTIQGEECELSIKNDLTWGEVKNILGKCMINGQFNFQNFFDIIPSVTITDGLPFDNTMPNFINLGFTDYSAIVGEVLKVIPLKIWLKNLQLEDLVALNANKIA